MVVRICIAVCRAIARMSALACSEKTIASSRVLIAANLFHGEAEAGDYFFEGDAWAVLEPLLRSRDGAFLFGGDGPVVNGALPMEAALGSVMTSRSRTTASNWLGASW